MKKLFLTLSLVATLVFTSCDNDNAVNPQPTGKATITGIVYAEFDETNNEEEDTWDVVANNKMTVLLLKGDEGSVRFAEVTTDASGAYTLEVDLGNEPLTLQIVPADFRHDVKMPEDKTESVIFTGDSFENPIVKVFKGGAYIRDIHPND